MWRMLQQDRPDDFVIATGETHTVRAAWRSRSTRPGSTGSAHVVIDDAFLRPAEVDLLVGDSRRPSGSSGWTPTTEFEELIRLMVDADRELLAR